MTIDHWRMFISTQKIIFEYTEYFKFYYIFSMAHLPSWHIGISPDQFPKVHSTNSGPFTSNPSLQVNFAFIPWSILGAITIPCLGGLGRCLHLNYKTGKCCILNMLHYTSVSCKNTQEWLSKCIVVVKLLVK